ncbi:hypothetical protein Nhal_3738 [Nitrosococcus halophilus Nc 4]|uniref:Uncharacterized protein n=1 Tax=Nitrosococcus halophilus (strain Nc4) TaxID=472759 RepID=D5C2T3_NITHN|nr:hypothetical protein Nhal_3738 [Nitrosococcus halophilus Nc 4]
MADAANLLALGKAATQLKGREVAIILVGSGHLGYEIIA